MRDTLPGATEASGGSHPANDGGAVDRVGARDDLLGRAAAASFAEIRNVLTALVANTVLARAAASDLAALVHARPSLGGDDAIEVPAALGELLVAVGDAEAAAARLKVMLLALERLALPEAQPSTVGELVSAAESVAHHMTKLVGGVRLVDVAEDVALAGRGGAALRVLSALLADLASRQAKRAAWSGLAISAHAGAGLLVIRVATHLPEEDVVGAVAAIAPLVDAGEVGVGVDGAAAVVTLPLDAG
jgi:hypothetical protein